jgi:hypothetical protein
MQTQAFTSSARFGVARKVGPMRVPSARSAPMIVRAAAAEGEMVDEMGFKLMRKGVKVAAKDTILTPRYVFRSQCQLCFFSRLILALSY